jgi:hypothetical protein
VSVLNVAPTTAADSVSVTVNEAEIAENTGTYGDPGDDTVSLTASIGTIVDNSDSTWSWSFNTSDGPDESQIVTITATDSDGAACSMTFSLTVVNVAPTVAPDNVSVTVNEAQTAANTGTYGDIGDDTVSLEASIGEIIDNGDGTWNWSCIPADGPDNSQTVTITATDSDGAISSITFELTVLNVAPEIETLTTSNMTPCMASPDGFVTIGGSYLDPALDLDTHTVSVDWGDGSDPDGDGVTGELLASVDQVNDLFSGSHTYANGGIFTITATVIDEDGGVSEQVTTTAAVVGVGVNNGQLQIIGTNGKDDVEIKLYTGRGSDGDSGKDKKAKGGCDNGSDIAMIQVKAKFDKGNSEGDGDKCKKGKGASDGGIDIDFRVALDEVHDILIILCDGDDKVMFHEKIDIDATIYGGGGRDDITGGSGDDIIYGDAGDDDLRGQDGNDALFGGEGDDKLSGDRGNDLLDGGDGDDHLKGDSGCSDGGRDGRADLNADILLGGSGNDNLDGGGGSDLLIGGAGADDIKGGSKSKKSDLGDILIGDWTSHDSSPAALRAILSQWTSDLEAGLDYDEIVDNLVAGWLRPDQIFDDGVKDKLYGSNKARDLFFADQDWKDGDDDKLKGDKHDRVIEIDLQD